MLTIFTIPKSFENHIDVIQRNAIRSWTLLRPSCEIILCGNDLGVEEAAAEFGVKYLPDIARNEFGTPLLNSAFAKVANVSESSFLCYVNADIIMLNDLIDAIRRIHFKQFLAIGRRINVELTARLDYEKANWRLELVEFATQNGQFAGMDWIDYFVFPKNRQLEVMPAFAVGRPEWDNWFIFNARKYGIPIVDITRVCPVIHQNHDYSHVPQGEGNSWNGPEATQNHNLYVQSLGALGHICNIWDATHILTRNFLLPALSSRNITQRWYTTTILHPSLKPIADLLDPILGRWLDQ